MSNGINIAVISGTIVGNGFAVYNNTIRGEIENVVAGSNGPVTTRFIVTMRPEYGTPLMPYLQAGKWIAAVGKLECVASMIGGNPAQLNYLYADKVTMGDLNVVMLSGAIQPNDARLNYTGNQKAVANWSFAVNEYAGGSGADRKERTFWFRPALWGKRAESMINALKKGAGMILVGTFVASKPFVGQDGVARANTEIWVDNIVLQGSKPPTQQAAAPQTSGDPLADWAEQELGGQRDDDSSVDEEAPLQF